MAKAVYQESSGAVLFQNTPEEFDIIKLKEKIRILENTVKRLESLAKESSNSNKKLATKIEELEGLIRALPDSSEELE